MKRVVSGLFVCIVMATSPGAHASICANGKIPLNTEYHESRYVLSGHIVSRGKPFRRYYWHDGRKTYDEYQKVTVKVDDRFKGFPAKTIAFYDSNDSARLPADTGDHWLLFFYAANDWRQVFVDTCGSSGSLSDPETAETIKALKDIR